LVYGLWKEKKGYFVMVIFILINLSCLFFIGYNDKSGLNNRLLGFYSNIKNLQEIKNPQEIRNPLKIENSQIDTQGQNTVDNSTSDITMNNRVVSDPYHVKRYAHIAPPNLWEHLGRKNGIDTRYHTNSIMIHLFLSQPITGVCTWILFYVNGEYYKIDPHCNILLFFYATGIIGGIAFLITACRGFIDSYLCFRYYKNFDWIAVLFFVGFIPQLIGNRVIAYPYLWIPLVIMRACIISQPKDEIVET
jgi:hypothetical protein